MPASWNDLVKIPSAAEFVDKFIALFRLGGFPIASWHDGSLQKHTVESESSLFSDMALAVQKLAKSGFIKYSAEIGDDWVDLCAEGFDEVRKPAVFTQGKYRVTDAGGIGPVPLPPGTFWVGTPGAALRYVNVSGTAGAPDTVPLNGSVEITIQAESPGSAWNVASGSITELLTPQPGLLGTNPVQSNGTWITQQGADVESSLSLVLRCLNKWATLGAGSNEQAYLYRVSKASAEITRQRAYSPYGGAVRVVVGGPNGPVSATALALADAVVQATRPFGVPDIGTLNATVRQTPIVGVLKKSGDPAAIIAAARQAVDALARSDDFGSFVERERIVQVLMNTGLTGLDLAEPAADFQVEKYELWVPVYSLEVA